MNTCLLLIDFLLDGGTMTQVPAFVNRPVGLQGRKMAVTGDRRLGREPLWMDWPAGRSGRLERLIFPIKRC